MLKLTFFFLLLLITSCNVVKINANSISRKFSRKTIKNYQYKSKDFELNYWKGGEGPVILFLHGFGGDAQLTWKKELLTLSKNHTVIAPDLLWFGKSNGTVTPTLNNQTIVIKQLLNYLKIDTFSIIGQSYGGFLALNLTLNNPSYVKKLCIANCPGNTFNKDELKHVAEKYKVQNVSDLFVVKNDQELKRLYSLIVFKQQYIPTILLKQMYQMYFNQHHKALEELMLSLQLETLSTEKNDILKNLKTVVIWGENDALFSVTEGRKFAASIHASFQSIQKCGHAAQIDQPKLFSNAVVSFFND